MITVPGALEDKNNLSDEEFQSKWGRTKLGYVSGNPMEVRAEQPTKEVPDGFWATYFASIASSPVMFWLQTKFADIGKAPDPNFKLTLENTKGYEDYLGLFNQATSEEDLDTLKALVDRRRLHEQIVAESGGFFGTSGWLAGMATDPTFFASSPIVGIGLKAAKGVSWYNKARGLAGKFLADKFGKDFAASAGGMMLKGGLTGAGVGAATGAVFSGFEALTKDTDSKEVISRMLGFSLLGAVPGFVVGAGKSQLALMQNKRLNKLVDEIAKDNPTKIVLTTENFQKALNDEKFLNAQVKSALGMEHLGASPDIRGNMSQSNVMRSITNILVDNPIQLVDEKTGQMITVSASVESVALSRSAEMLFNLQKVIDDGYSNWLKNKYGDSLITKAKAWKDLKVWANGNSYKEFMAEVGKELHNPGSSTNEFVKSFSDKIYNDFIKPLSDYGMKHDLWNYKKTKAYELNEKKVGIEKEIKNRTRRIESIISQRKINVPIGKVNGSMKSQDVTIGAVEKHLKGLDKSIVKKQKERDVLEKINKEISPNIKDSKKFRKLTSDLKNVRSSFEKETKANIREYFSEKIKADTKFESLEEAIKAEEKVVADLIESTNLKSDVAIKPSELKELGKVEERIRVLEKKIKSSSRKQPRQEKLLKTLRMHKSFLEFLGKKSKGTTPADWKKLGKEQKILKDLIKERDAVVEKDKKLFEKGSKKQSELEDKFVEALEKLIPEIDKLKANPNAKLTEGQLRELKGKVKEQIKKINEEEKALVKDKELKSKAVEDARAERSDEIEKLKSEIEAQTKELEETNKAIEDNDKKVYTHEDFRDLPEGERYFPRVFDAIKVAKDRAGCTKAIENGLWSVSDFKELRTKKKLSASEQKAIDKEAARIKEEAKRVVEKILHENDKGYVLNPRKTRSFEHERTLNFSTEYIKDYIIDDPMNSLRELIRTVYTDTELLKRVGTLNVNELLERVDEDFDKLIEAAESEQQRKAFVNQKKKAAEDLTCLWCRVRGVKQYAAEDLNYWGRAFNHAANIINNLNVARLIGGTVISATSDLAQACMTVGFKNFFKGLGKWFNKDFRATFMGEEGVWLRAIDFFKSTRQLGFYDQLMDKGFLAAVDNFSGRLADLGVKASFIEKWDEMNKFVVGYVTQERILKIGENVAKGGKLAVKDLEWLNSTGITKENAVKMFDQFKKHGRITESGIWESSVGFWDDEKLQDLFRGGVKKLQNQAILTPTAGSVPIIFDRHGLKTVLQFKRFTFNAYSKCLLPTLQKRDFEAFAGITMMMSLGVMKAYLRALKNGTTITMLDAVKSSLKEAEVGAFFGDAYGLGSIMLGMNEDQNQASRKFMRDAFGTGYDFADTYLDAVPGLFKLITGLGGDLSASQIHKIRKALPLQNNIWLAWVFNKFEEKAIESRGTEKAKDNLLKKRLIENLNL